MAKSSKSRDAAGVANRSSILRSIESCPTHRIDCCICGEEEEAVGGTALEFARDLHDQGWAQIESEKFCVIGVACPACVSTPDKERGEG